MNIEEFELAIKKLLEDRPVLTKAKKSRNWAKPKKQRLEKLALMYMIP